MKQPFQKRNTLLNYLKGNKDRLVIDGDTHPTHIDQLNGNILEKYLSSKDYYHGKPVSDKELLLEMQMAKVDMALIWQNPAVLSYTDDINENFRKLRKANESIFDLGDQYPEQFIPAGWTDPKALGIHNAKKLTEICIREWEFPVVKMNPAQNEFQIDDKNVIEIVEQIISLGGVPAFHFGGDTQFTPASGLEKLARMFPEAPIIAVHMGGGGSHYIGGEQLYIEARETGLRNPNIFYILSSKRDCHIESDLIRYTLAGEPFSKNIAIASDAPYGRLCWNFGGYRLMFESLMDHKNHTDERVRNSPELFNKEIIQDFMGRNLAELLIKILENRVIKK